MPEPPSGVAPSTQATKVFRGYYYLVPVWFFVESYCWSGMRAGLIVGDSTWARFAFYLLEAGIGTALWFGLRWSEPAALVENVAYLVAGARFVLLAPIDIAANIEQSSALPAIDHYVHAVPGILFSMFAVVFQLYRRGYCSFFPDDA